MKQDYTDKPVVSVVTVCFNAARDLERTIGSVERQTARDVEFVVIDGGSTDTTKEVIERHRDNIDRFVSEPDGGIYDAMNKGVRLATGRFVIFMNAGDTFAADDVIERVIASGAFDRADVVYGDVVKGNVVKKASAPANCHRMFFCHQSCFGLRERLLETPFDTSHPMSADFKWVKSMIKQGRRFERLDFPVAVFDTNGVSNRRRSAGLRDNIDVVFEMDGFFDRMRLLPRLYVPYIVSLLRHR